MCMIPFVIVKDRANAVISFEPMPTNAMRLLASVRKNSFQARFHLVSVCVSDEPGTHLCQLGLNPSNQGHLRHQIGSSSSSSLPPSLAAAEAPSSSSSSFSSFSSGGGGSAPSTTLAGGAASGRQQEAARGSALSSGAGGSNGLSDEGLFSSGASLLTSAAVRVDDVLPPQTTRGIFLKVMRAGSRHVRHASMHL